MASACLPSCRRLDVSLSAPAALVERIRSSARPLAAKTFPALALALAAALLFRRVRERTAFDEGVYLDSLRSLKDGHVLGSEVFASQVPGFYSLLELDALGIRPHAAPPGYRATTTQASSFGLAYFASTASAIV